MSKAHLYFFLFPVFSPIFYPTFPTHAVCSIHLNDPLYEGEQQIWFIKTGNLYITSGILRMCAMIAFVMILEDELQGQLRIKSQPKQKSLWRSVEAVTTKKKSLKSLQNLFIQCIPHTLSIKNKHGDVFLFFYLSNKNMHQQTLWAYFHPASSLSVMGETPLHIYRGTCGRRVALSGRQHWHLDHRPLTDATSLIETRAPLHAVFQPQQEKTLSDRI